MFARVVNSGRKSVLRIGRIGAGDTTDKRPAPTFCYDILPLVGLRLFGNPGVLHRRTGRARRRRLTGARCPSGHWRLNLRFNHLSATGLGD